MAESCLMCELLGTTGHKPSDARSNVAPQAVNGSCRDRFVMTLAERFPELPFVAMVKAVQLTASAVSATTPGLTDAEVQARAIALILSR